jgi:glycosyltransferase involved in cell wall biosynthesis
VYPPVDTEFFVPPAHPATAAAAQRPDASASKFLIVSALVPYKRVDLAMMAARHAGVGLTVVGDGPERARLEQYAGDGIELVGWLEDAAIREHYQSCVAAVLPGEEDFGIVPVEAQACGRPVVALGRGGALDTVIDGETGVLFSATTVESLSAAMTRAAATTWERDRIRRHAERFSRARFVRDIERVVDETLRAPAGRRW